MASPRTTYAVLAALAALISGFSLLRGVDPFDEGLMLQAAERITAGELPYRDFLYPYGPGQPFLLAGLQELFGPSLLTWRIVRLAVDVAVAVGVFALVRREAPLPLALLAWLAAATAMAQPLSANPFPLALLLGLAAVGLATGPRSLRRLALAGAVTGVAAAWRLDFGAYVALACLAAALLGPSDRRRLAGAYLAALAGAVLVLYGPLVAAAGVGDAWDALVAKSLREREWWTLPFPLSYDGGFALWPPGELAHDAKDVLDFYVPLLLVIGTGVAAGLAALRALAERTVPWQLAAWAVLAFGFVQYLRSRTDAFHETPLIVVLAVALALCAGWALRSADLSAGARRLAAGAAAGTLALLALAGTADRLSALFDPPELERLDLPLADGVRAEPAEARGLPQAVALVQELVPEGEPIHVVTRRSDLVRIGNPLFPYLARRPTVLDRDFDLWTSADAQREVVAALERARPRAVVRWNHPTTVEREDNLRGEPSGSRLLDEYLDDEYRVRVRFEWYEVLAPRDG